MVEYIVKMGKPYDIGKALHYFNVPFVEIRRAESPWHTGIPTEEGKYLCWVSFPDTCKDGEDLWKCKWLNGEWIDDEVNGKFSLNNFGFKVIAWQKIEENEDVIHEKT